MKRTVLIFLSNAILGGLIGWLVDDLGYSGWALFVFGILTVLAGLVIFRRRVHRHAWQYLPGQTQVWVEAAPLYYIPPVCTIRFCPDCGRFQGSPAGSFLRDARTRWWNVRDVVGTLVEVRITESLVIRMQPGSLIVDLPPRELYDFLASQPKYNFKIESVE